MGRMKLRLVSIMQGRILPGLTGLAELRNLCLQGIELLLEVKKIGWLILDWPWRKE